jgi:hypothetical protein
MKTRTKVITAFIAGAAVMNIPTVFSNADGSEQLIVRALASALNAVNESERKREQETLNKLPNILDCQNMEWMRNCTEINNQAKQNPTAPLRVTNPKGIEYNFVPGTPSAVIKLQLEQTPEAAAEMVTYMDTTWGEYKKAAGLYQQAMWRRGPLDNILGLERAKALEDQAKEFESKDLSVSVFVHSQCGACDVQLTALASLQNRYPKLAIRVFQADQDTAAFKRKVTDQGLAGRVLTLKETAQIHSTGVSKLPVTWIDNKRLSRRADLQGANTLPQLEDHLQAMSLITTALK